MDRQACTFVQSDQQLCYSLFGKYKSETCYMQSFLIFKLVYVAEQIDFILTWSETPIAGFHQKRYIYSKQILLQIPTLRGNYCWSVV